MDNIADELLSRSMNLESFAAKNIPIEDVLDAYVRFKVLNDEFQKLAKGYNVFLKEYKDKVIPELMKEAGVDSISMANGYRVSSSTRTFASTKADMKEDAIRWLKDNGYDIVTETINASTLSGLARELAEEARELPEDIFKVSTLDSVSVTKTK